MSYEKGVYLKWITLRPSNKNYVFLFPAQYFSYLLHNFVSETV